jgi:hypothetical protein
LRRLTGRNQSDIVGQEAHHVLPQEFEEEIVAAGIDSINDPVFGAWVDANDHRHWSYAYNEQWRRFLKQKPTRNDILIFAQGLAEEYGFDVYFETP